MSAANRPTNHLQLVVAEDLDGAVVRFQGVVEGQLLLAEAELLATLVGLPHVPRQLDQLGDDLGRRDRAVLVLDDRGLQHLRKGPGLDHVLPGPDLDLVGHQPPEEFDSQVAVR